jgi:hypothetical protein
MPREIYPLNDAIEVPDVAEPVLGFRCWDYNEDFTGLCSLHGVWTLWPNDEPLKAICATYAHSASGVYAQYRHTGNLRAILTRFGHDGKFVHPPEAYTHRAPGKTCQCGIYAAYNFDIVASYADTVRVFGLVTAWGLVIPGSNGFRAEYAKPVVLFDIDPAHTVERRKLQRVAGNYNVPLVEPHSEHVEDYREGVRSGIWQPQAK